MAERTLTDVCVRVSWQILGITTLNTKGAKRPPSKPASQVVVRRVERIEGGVLAKAVKRLGVVCRADTSISSPGTPHQLRPCDSDAPYVACAGDRGAQPWV